MVSFLNKTFEMTQYLETICESLNIWMIELCPFLNITKIYDKEVYKEKLLIDHRYIAYKKLEEKIKVYF